MHFQMDFLELVCWHFYSNLTETYSKESIWQKVIIGLGNDLGSNRRQAITWTNIDQDPGHEWRH